MTALIELDGIFLYIFERSQKAADAVVRRIEDLTAQIGQFPYQGHPADEDGARAIPVVRYPYVIFYAIDLASDEVVILHVRHTSRQPPTEV